MASSDSTWRVKPRSCAPGLTESKAKIKSGLNVSKRSQTQKTAYGLIPFK